MGKDFEIDETDGAPRNESLSWCVYVLRCSDSSFYTGVTNCLRKRLLAHRAGKGSKYVKSRSPFTVARIIGCKDEHEARSLEYRLKKMTRSRKSALLGLHDVTSGDPRGEDLDPDMTADEIIPTESSKKYKNVHA